MQGVLNRYKTLLKQVKAASPSTKLIVNGYAYARPHAHGIYIGTKFESRGFDLLVARRKALASAIVRFMVDRFNAMLKTFATNNPQNVVYVDLRPVVRPDHDGDWHDSSSTPRPVVRRGSPRRSGRICRGPGFRPEPPLKMRREPRRLCKPW
jgi:hypothetical protein